ncbi:NAD(P)-dependent oxidoreductase [Nitratidesulfovibrio termitidis]|uniref:NAD(P)-dependent oxidoreductase n=1 Tax=Nitratidesulfovibrio termitidis TaxID=42252 RepID=UPI0004190480|nr:NAD(P)-dependent oxidoreductase [Nitratidesulfovibrio termitidis]
MSHIAILGLGAMGKRMAANLLKAGHQVTVWNRTAKAAEPLLALGATQAANPKDAAAGADFVLAMVRDDDASSKVWLDAETGAFAGLRPNAIAMDSSTLSVDWIKKLGAEAANRGVTLLETPVSGSLPQADAAQLIFLVGGSAEACKKAEPVLLAMGSAVNHAGEIGTGALTKLATNALLGVQVTAIAELIGLLHHNGADVHKIMGIIAGTAVWSPYAQRAIGALLSGEAPVMFPVELIEKDFGYAMKAAGSPDAAPTIAAAREVFQRGMAEGLGDANLTSVVKLFRA